MAQEDFIRLDVHESPTLVVTVNYGYAHNLGEAEKTAAEFADCYKDYTNS